MIPKMQEGKTLPIVNRLVEVNYTCTPSPLERMCCHFEHSVQGNSAKRIYQPVQQFRQNHLSGTNIPYAPQNQVSQAAGASIYCGER